MRKNSRQCHNNPYFIPPCKPPNPGMYLYDGHKYGLKTSMDVLTSMDVVPVDYGISPQNFTLKCSYLDL